MCRRCENPRNHCVVLYVHCVPDPCLNRDSCYPSYYSFFLLLLFPAGFISYPGPTGPAGYSDLAWVGDDAAIAIYENGDVEFAERVSVSVLTKSWLEGKGN